MKKKASRWPVFVLLHLVLTRLEADTPSVFTADKIHLASSRN
ncbi:hypothetical protein [Neobacillus niacini]|nr:hypothetical protein [Neobacillus niacini]